MRNILLTIEYDGSFFSGWARQKNAITVQGQLEEILSIVCGCEVTLEGTGRTDAGVHALGQRATLKGNFGIPVEKIPVAANALLAVNRFKWGYIRIKEALEMPLDFHARFDALGKTYTYMVRMADNMPVFLTNYRYLVNKKLNLNDMEKALKYFIGQHDFAAFMAAGGTPKESTVRNIFGAKLDCYSMENCSIKVGNDSDLHPIDIGISITGDGFLYNMVRIIVGTLIDVGLGKISVEKVPSIISDCDRKLAGHTAPPQGLFMRQVYFNEKELSEGIWESSGNLPYLW